MSTIAANRRDHSLVTYHIYAALTVKLIFAEAVLLVTFLANIVNDVLLLSLPLSILYLYLVELNFTLWAGVSFFRPNLNALRTIPMLTPIQARKQLHLFWHFPTNCTFVVIVMLLQSLITPPIAFNVFIFVEVLVARLVVLCCRIT